MVHFASASAASSAATRSWSRSRPRPGSRPRCASACTPPRSQLARAARYTGLGTVEFLVDADAPESFYFIEANARLQVEHTVTEAVTGIDLVALQLDLAEGRSLAELGLAQASVPAPRGYAIQLRVNTEKLRAKDGLALPASGTLTAFEPPDGPGVRTDTAGHVGYASNPRFDSLLAKVIVHSPSPRFADLLPRAERALAEFRIEGIETNRGLLLALLRHPALARAARHDALRRGARGGARRGRGAATTAAVPRRARRRAAPTARVGAAVDPRRSARGARARQVALRRQRRARAACAQRAERRAPPGAVAVRAPLAGTVASFAVGEGDAVAAGRALLVLEAMKMEHVIEADRSGIVRALAAAPGETVAEGQPLVWLEEAEVASGAGDAAPAVDLDAHPPRPRRGASSATRSASTRAGPTRSRAGARPASAPRARTSRTSATRAASSSTARSRSRRSGAAARSKT